MSEMKIRKKFPLLLLVVLVPAICLVPTVHAEGGQYRDYYTFMDAFMSLTSAYPELVTYETIGKTVENRDIIMFKIGNPAGGRVLFDGALHGEENLGSEVLYFYAKWLLSSNDPIANRILTGAYTLLIPALNVDNYRNVRTNAHHVDLNRNFATNWEYAGSTNPSSWYYRGPAPLSEPESQALVSVFQTYEPHFYMNLHRGATLFYVSNYGNTTYYSLLFEKMEALSRERGVTPYPYSFIRGAGFAISDAARAGITSFLLELIDWETIVSFAEIETVVLPTFIPVAAVLTQECALFPHIPPWDLNQDGRVSIVDMTVVALAFGSTPESTNWNPLADLNADKIVDVFDLKVVSMHFGEESM